MPATNQRISKKQRRVLRQQGILDETNQLTVKLSYQSKYQTHD